MWQGTFDCFVMRFFLYFSMCIVFYFCLFSHGSGVLDGAAGRRTTALSSLVASPLTFHHHSAADIEACKRQ